MRFVKMNVDVFTPVFKNETDEMATLRLLQFHYIAPMDQTLSDRHFYFSNFSDPVAIGTNDEENSNE